MFNMLQKKHELVVPLKGLSPIKLKHKRMVEVAGRWCTFICLPGPYTTAERYAKCVLQA